MSGRHRYAFAAWGAIVAAGCAGSADERVEVPAEAAAHAREMTFGTVEEMEAELEVLDHEIAGLAEYLAARPPATPAPGAPDPGDVLEAARATRAAAATALSVDDTARAADSLRAAAARVEHVKRLLGVAEEMGVDFEPDGAAPAAD